LFAMNAVSFPMQSKLFVNLLFEVTRFSCQFRSRIPWKLYLSAAFLTVPSYAIFLRIPVLGFAKSILTHFLVVLLWLALLFPLRLSS
jgi:hypothetical protein